MHKIKKHLASILIMAMLLTLLPQAVLAARTPAAGAVPAIFTASIESNVSYNGKKHMPVILISGNAPENPPAKKNISRDLVVSVSCDLLSYATLKYSVKYNKSASAGAKKQPRITFKLKAKKGTPQEIRDAIKILNRELKANPLNFEIGRKNLKDVTLEGVPSKGKKVLKKLYVTVDGKRFKLTRKDFSAERTESGILVTGLRNFCGTKTLDEKGRELPSPEPDPEPVDAKDSGIRKIFSDLGLSLLGSAKIRSDIASGKNIAVSAYSIENAMGMAANGAKGDTLAEIEASVFGGEKLADFNKDIQEYNKHVKNLNAEGFTTNLANGIWVNNLPLNPDFAKSVSENYGAGIKSAPFGAGTADEINDFVSKNTKGMIKKAVDEVPTDMVTVLVNALYLEGVWDETFNEENIIDDQDFTDSKGNVQKTTMLRDSENSTYFSYRGADGIIKDLKDGRGKFIAILPPKGMSCNEFLDKCDSDMMAEINAGIHRKCELTTLFPEFEYEYETSLNEPLEEMGVKKALSKSADLSGMLDADLPVYISEAVHMTHVKVDREGAKAAAATVIGAATTSAGNQKERRTVIFERPFLYMLTDDNSVPLFIGTVNTVK